MKYEEHANGKQRQWKWCKRVNRWNDRYDSSNNNHDKSIQQPMNVPREMNQPPLMCNTQVIPV